MKKLSVIIPVYNGEQTIERCILSVLNQTFKDLDVVVVNDGSTDGTERIVRRLIQNDNRIRLFNIENSGVSNARNFGIDNSTGEYLAFIDSDDYIDAEMYDYLISTIIEEKVEICHCSYKNVSSDASIVSIIGNTNKKIVQSHDEALECLLSGKLFTGSLCNKIYSRRIIGNIRFESDLKFNEDVLFNTQVFNNVNKSVYLDYAFYNYVQNISSATHTANDVLFATQCLQVSKRIKDIFDGTSLENISSTKVARNLIVVYRTYILSPDYVSKVEKKKIYNEINYYMDLGYYKSLKEMIQIYMFRFFPVCYKTLYKLYDKIRKKELDPKQ